MTHRDHDRSVYPPLDRLKPVAPDLWIVDSGPLHLAGVAFPVRMTVVRLSSGGMWLHSPTPFIATLRGEIERLGPIRHLVAPNFAHWMFVRDWQREVPEAETWAAPGLRERGTVRKSGVRLDHDLGEVPPDTWAADIDQITVPGGFGVTEVGFLHRTSRTLVLTDLVENFEPEKLSPVARPLVRAAGAMSPEGMAPIHYRLALNRNRATVAAAARRMLDWAPEKVIFAHGAWFESDGTAQLRHSFRWLLD
jgi:hypothetical protein